MLITALEKTAPLLTPAPRQWTVVIVGTGGTGSHLAKAAAQLAFHHDDRGGTPIRLILVDGDRVEPKNVGRQDFAWAEIGRNKAETLAARMNAALGLRVEAIDQYATTALLQALTPTERRSGILVGCVDNAPARQSLHATLNPGNGWLGWLDLGNDASGGQVAFGTHPAAAGLHGALRIPTLAAALPAPSLQFPKLLVPEPPQDDDCARAVERDEQSINVNRWMAAVGAEYLRQIIDTGKLDYLHTTVDLAILAMRSTAITPGNVARVVRRGLTVEALTGTAPYTPAWTCRIYDAGKRKQRNSKQRAAHSGQERRAA